MTDTATKIDAENGSETAQKRERSSIAFPYQDLDDAIEAATTVYDHVGTGTCEEAQLAGWLDQSPTSSGFRGRLATARLFGLMDGDGASMRCTDLGQRIVDPKQARGAKVDAFLRVPLFAALYERFKTTVLPSQAAALEREIVSLGVAEKQKDRARQVFLRSAEQAGFFEHGKERLVKPGVAPIAPSTDVQPPPPPPPGGGGGGDGGGLRLDPLLIALLKKIPESGEWPAEKRLRWFRTFAMNVSQIYDEGGEPVELKIDFAIMS